MRKLLEWVGLLLILISATDIFFSVVKTCHDVGYQPSQSQATQQHCNAYSGPLFSGLVWLFEIMEPEWVIALFTVILAVSTIGLWISTSAAARGGERAANIALLTLRVANRPVLLLSAVDFKEPTGKDVATRITFSIENSGNGIADIERASIEIRVALLRDGSVLYRRDTIDESWNAAVGSKEVSGEHSVKTRLITAEDIVNFRAGKSRIALIFVFYFKDILGNKFEGGFPMIFDHTRDAFMRTTITFLDAQHWGSAN